jgi:hypothetical protein
MEVIVVVDADCEPDLPNDDSIRVLWTSGGVGPSRAKHLGISSAEGDLIALLDDDDLWRPDKLEKQLAAAPPGDDWILSCRYIQHVDGRAPVTLPRTLLGRDEQIAPYLFQFHSPPPRRVRWMAVPTLVFPRAVAQRVPWSVAADSIHEDPKWLMEVRRALPSLRIVQVPEPLVDVICTPRSISRPGVDQSKQFIEWGIRELADESSRVRGDYMLGDPVTSAIAAGSFRGVVRSMVAGLRSGRPGLWAWLYAAAAIVRIGWRRVKSLKGGSSQP